MSGIVCSETEEFFRSGVVEFAFVAVVGERQWREDGQEGEVWALPVGGLHWGHWGRLKEGEVVRYYTLWRGGRLFNVETMTCRGRSVEEEECTWEMWVRKESVCFGAKHSCMLELVLEGQDEVELASVRRALLVQRLPLGSRD